MTPKTLNVLISLHKGYGLGDAVQMSAVLRHVASYRPHWRVDYRAEAGKHVVGRGIVQNTFVTGSCNPTDHYDCEVEILLWDTWANWQDRPNTRVSSCLRERFDLDWDAECGRYQVAVSEESCIAAWSLVHGLVTSHKTQGSYRGENARREVGVVAIHYEGDSSPNKKNLSHNQANEICREVERIGYIPVVLDWRARSTITDYRLIRTPQAWGRDAEMVTAVIAQCCAFVGIDSGPSKCASATDTPSLVVWTGHHPAPFHDPAPNTTHLVPVGYHGLEPVCNDPGVMRWFEAHHKVEQYERDPVESVKKWLNKVL